MAGSKGGACLPIALSTVLLHYGGTVSLIEIHRRCKECEKSNALLLEVRAEMDQIRLDYHNLYEKVRTNLAKLAKRADKEDENGPDTDFDPLAKGRALLFQRKMNRG